MEWNPWQCKISLVANKSRRCCMCVLYRLSGVNLFHLVLAVSQVWSLARFPSLCLCLLPQHTKTPVVAAVVAVVAAAGTLVVTGSRVPSFSLINGVSVLCAVGLC